MCEELLRIEEAVNTTEMRPQQHRLNGENIVLHVFYFYRDDDVFCIVTKIFVIRQMCNMIK
jgi:hypothetical protein